ncbi:type II toxin-antitoxin system RelE family toxin [Culicoidibacter larvae]|uniref:Type II toxin-antitoxin system RelE/ParE family toxin n=1 Tax=Culicoidibacter larvae TaxID=2579976 RepID=A0A5R8QHN2_9FIRM|nr:type II toxin-antitoxin system RelE/ParE family toxin [Culicoidibacter larvae]TLG77518.1 type II toxin-antitoxin system RelE/ParE family toxin [Culicoidibacter larvae]
MFYKVEFTKTAIKELKKLDKPQQALLMAWIKKNLQNCENPRISGKALKGNKSAYWRYRIGSYRIITELVDERLLIIIINIGHRKDIYK